jgi:acetyl-CoA carboxylase biotin carboxyl carrier protein
MNFNEIQELIRMVSKHKLSEFILREGDFRLIIRNPSSLEPAVPVVVTAPVQQPVVTIAPPTVTAPVTAVAAPAPVETPALPAAEDLSRFVPIKSPMVGTFYRSSGPDKAAFAKIGDLVDKGQSVCIIEAMKLFNEIESDIKGKIVKVLVEDASPVEYDQPLFLVEPA